MKTLSPQTPSLPAKQNPPEADKASEASGATAAVVIRSAYDNRRVRVRLICVDGEGRTIQSAKDECDINVLMRRYAKTGVLPPAREGEPVYADVSALDFTESMQQVARVNGFFSRLPAAVRARFENSPAVMLEFVADPANQAEAVKMGLIEAPTEPQAPPAPAQGGGVQTPPSSVAPATPTATPA